MKTVVVDTNVAVVANAMANHVQDEQCVDACVDALLNIVAKGRVAVDDGYRIFVEYRRYLSPSGQPGVRDMFFKWVWDNQANEDRVEQVHIRPKDDGDNDFEEFPNDSALSRFHRHDRKFVAVALASAYRPKILNASDTHWWQYRNVLAKYGCRIIFLCPNQMIH